MEVKRIAFNQHPMDEERMVLFCPMCDHDLRFRTPQLAVCDNCGSFIDNGPSDDGMRYFLRLTVRRSG